MKLSDEAGPAEGGWGWGPQTIAPACLPACLPACVPACLPACLPAWLRRPSGGGGGGGATPPTPATRAPQGNFWGDSLVQGVIKIGLFLKKARVTAVTESLDLFLTHGLTCTLPSCQILWTRSKRSLAWARKQAEINKYGFVCVFFFFFFFL